MNKTARVYVAGHRGLAGGAIHRILLRRGFVNIITRTHKDVDLSDQRSVRLFFEAERPEYVFLAAAKVGGIQANDTYPADFIHANLTIQTNVIDESYHAGVKKLVFLGSSCIYPRDCPQPIREDYMMTGPLESTNRAYAIAKIAGIEMCQAYNRQFGTHFMSAMPTNLYGLGDNYDLKTSHVLPALIRKFHEALPDKPVTVWGTGEPRREFLYNDDLADACLFLMDKYEGSEIVNVGVGEDMTIAELALTVQEVLGHHGEIIWDSSKPDGTPQKLLDISRITALGWEPKVGLREGIALAYADFKNRYA